MSLPLFTTPYVPASRAEARAMLAALQTAWKAGQADGITSVHAAGVPTAFQRVRRFLSALGGAVVIVMLTHPNVAHAAAGGGGGLPWDTPLTTLRNNLTGPFAFTISLLALVAAGCVLVFGGEISEFMRRIIYAIMVAAFLVGVTNFASALGITGAVL